MSVDSFIHVFRDGRPDRPVLLVLHGTGGDEQDLLGLAQTVDPFAAILSVRGKVLENGMPRFFRRKAEGVFDLEDLRLRTDELADFVHAARDHYQLSGRQIVALGFSNGANIAASMLFRQPAILDGAMLLRAMVPFNPEKLPDLSGKQILMLSGLLDQIVPLDNAKTLASLFEQAGASLVFTVKPVTHGLVPGDIAAMQQWLASRPAAALAAGI